jgi:hypothetical protein
MAKKNDKKHRIKQDKKELYDPLYKIMNKVISQMEDIDLDVPIYKIAWMEVRGKFLPKRHKALRADTMDFLRVSNEYRRIYWNIIKLARRKFEVEMINDGSFAPDVREYESLKNEIPFVLLKGNKRLWISTYDDYLPKIRERSTKHKKKPRKGETLYRAIYKDIREVKDTFKVQREESLKYAKQYRKRLKYARSNPDKPYEYWLENDKELADRRTEASNKRTKVKDTSEKKKNKD